MQAAADLDRVRAVTANFFFWQGLRWVPLGSILILSALIPLGKRFFNERWLSAPCSWSLSGSRRASSGDTTRTSTAASRVFLASIAGKRRLNGLSFIRQCSAR